MVANNFIKQMNQGDNLIGDSQVNDKKSALCCQKQCIIRNADFNYIIGFRLGN